MDRKQQIGSLAAFFCHRIKHGRIDLRLDSLSDLVTMPLAQSNFDNLARMLKLVDYRRG
ncbi:protein of unknown function [Methylocaldum szegediense]|uniref:Uncharacterized protein n=1 Tax=Methylocaldum szegediense TaxID=73780 RepID=A0ABN8X239_9GAMM|nr:protein of unknown function [Methylocaldum szegediense]